MTADTEALLLAYSEQALHQGADPRVVEMAEAMCRQYIQNRLAPHRTEERDGIRYTYGAESQSEQREMGKDGFDFPSRRDTAEGNDAASSPIPEKSLGDQLRELRNGTPIETVARHLHLQVETIARLEADERKLPPQCLKHILDYYAVPPQEQEWFQQQMASYRKRA